MCVPATPTASSSALGDRFCGYALFVKDGYLVHDYNTAGTHYVARSQRRATGGPERRCATASPRPASCADSARARWTAIDGDEIELARTLGVHISPAGLSIGWSALSPVSDLFESPFRFGGRIDEVVFELGSDRSGDPPNAIVD